MKIAEDSRKNICEESIMSPYYGACLMPLTEIENTGNANLEKKKGYKSICGIVHLRIGHF